MGSCRIRSLAQIQPRVYRCQVVDPAADNSQQQGLQASRGRWDCGVSCVAAVRFSFLFRSGSSYIVLLHLSFLFNPPFLFSFYLGSYQVMNTNRHAYRLGVPSRLLIFPDENHWVINAGNRYVCSSTRRS
jgi:hypothetical protein